MDLQRWLDDAAARHDVPGASVAVGTAEIGEEPRTARYVVLGGDRFIAAGPDDGLHPVLAFVEGGRYLFTTRAAPRVRA